MRISGYLSEVEFRLARASAYIGLRHDLSNVDLGTLKSPTHMYTYIHITYIYIYTYMYCITIYTLCINTYVYVLYTIYICITIYHIHI